MGFRRILTRIEREHKKLPDQVIGSEVFSFTRFSGLTVYGESNGRLGESFADLDFGINTLSVPLTS